MTVLGIIIGIFGFLFLITVHEGGHFLVAKSLGVRVNEFSVGMGPLIYQKEKNNTKYSFRLLPIGGYCALEGEFDEDMTDEEIENYVDTDPTGFVNQPLWKRLLILVAGSAVNMVFGIIIIICVYLYIAQGRVGFLRILQVSFEDATSLVSEIFNFLGGLFNGSSSVDDVSGVVGIVGVVAETAKIGLENVFYLIGILSVNLSVMNMLPIPGLDGGRIVTTTIKSILGDKFSQKTENIINTIGMILLFGLIILIAFKDVGRLIH